MKTIFKLLIIGLVAVLYSCSPKMSAKKKVYDLYLFTENGKWGYIDENGTVMIPPIYEGCCFEQLYIDDVCTQKFSSDELCVVKKGGKFGVIDAKGNEIIPFQYDDISFYSDDTLFEAKSNDKWGVIDIHNNLIFPFVFINEYDLILYNECGYGKIKEVVYKLDYKTKEMTPTECRYVYRCDDGFPLEKIDGQFGFMNKKGELIIQPIYQDVLPFVEGLAAVQLDGKWGFIDTLGNMVIKPQFDEVEGFSSIQDYANGIVVIDGKYGAIDRKGNWLIQPSYDYLCFSFENMFCARFNDEKGESCWILIDIKGEMVLPDKYRLILYNMYNGTITAENMERKYGVFILNTKEIIIPFEYEYIDSYNEDGLTLFLKKDSTSGKSHFGYFDKNGKVIWQEKIR